MGNLMVKSERKAMKELVKKNTKVNRDMIFSQEDNIIRKNSKSPQRRRVSFNTKVKQLEYDLENAEAGTLESQSALQEDNYMDSEEESGGEDYLVEQLASEDSYSGAAAATIRPSPPQNWSQNRGIQDSIIVNRNRQGGHKQDGSSDSDSPEHQGTLETNISAMQ